MHTAGLGFSFFLIVLGMLSGGTVERRADPALESRQAFDAVMRHLEPGGDFLLVANTENVVRNCAETLTDLATAAAEGQTGEQAVLTRRVAGALPAYLDRHGFLALRALGLSSVPQGGGIHRSRAFLLRDKAAMESPLWRGLVGGAPRPLISHDYWTDDVAWAASGTGDPSALWQVVRAAVDDLLPESREGFQEALKTLEAQLGMDPEALIRSLGGEGFVALTLDRQATFPVPTLQFSMPVPGLLVGLKLREPLLVERLNRLADEQSAGMPPIRTVVGETTLVSFSFPAPVPFPVQPTYAYCAKTGMLLLGSSADTVRKALETAASGQGRLFDSEDFKDEFGSPVPAVNGVWYAGRRWHAVLAELQKAGLSTLREQQPAAAPLFERLQTAVRADGFDVTLIVNEQEGVRMESLGTTGAQRYAQAGLLAPAGMLAAIAIPSFAKAREAAQQNACINNLRMLDAAKEQWALAHNAAEGAEPDVAGVAEYLKGGALPVCPKTQLPYRLNPISTDPECTSGISSHRLP